MPWSAATAATAKCKRQFIGFARRRISTTVSPWTCSAIPKRRTELKLLKPSTTSERAKKVPLMMLKTPLMMLKTQIGFKSIQENIDTTTSGGKLVFHIFGALAEFERDIIRERTNAGLQAARARGRKGGRPKALTPKKSAMAQALYNDKNNTVDEICKTLNISRATLYRYIVPCT